MALNNSKRINSIIYTNNFINKAVGDELWELQIPSRSNAAFKFDSIMENIFMNDINVDEIGLVTIDEECYKWLYENGLENTEENHLVYASQVNDEKMRELWNKHSLNINYDLYYIPVTVSKNESEFCSGNIQLSTDSILNIQNDISKHLNCNTNDIVILPHAYRIDYAVKNNDKIYKYALDTLENNESKSLPVGLYSQQNDIDVIQRFIAVFVRSDIDCICNIHAWDKKNSRFEYNKTITEMLSNDFDNNEIHLLNSLISITDIEDYSEHFYETYTHKSLECI